MLAINFRLAPTVTSSSLPATNSDALTWRLNLDDQVVQPAVASLGYPSGEPAAFAAAPSSGCADALLSACAYSPAPRLDRRPTSPARIGVFSPGSTGGKHPAFTVCYALPADWLPTSQLALVSSLQLGLRLLPTHIGRRPSARLARTTSGFRRLLLQLPACAFCRCNLQACARLLPPFAKPVVILRLASAVSPSGFTGFDSPGLRLALHTSGWAFDTPLTSTEPCIAG